MFPPCFGPRNKPPIRQSTELRGPGRLTFFARWVAAFVLPADLLSPRFVSRLLLPAFIANDALIPATSWTRWRLWHAFLAAMFTALILHAFQIVFPGHRATPFQF
jgi:hypothetical protein